MEMPAWLLATLLVGSFWFGFFVAAILGMSRDEKCPYPPPRGRRNDVRGDVFGRPDRPGDDPRASRGQGSAEKDSTSLWDRAEEYF